MTAEQAGLPMTRAAFLASVTAAAMTATAPPGSAGAVSRTDPMSPARLHRHVRELCAFGPRWTGYDNEEAAGRWLAKKLRAAGVRTAVDEYTFRQWRLANWRADLLHDGQRTRIRTFPLWSSKGGSGEAELVDVGFGTEPELLARDLRGKAVVVTGKALLNVFATYPDTYHRAAELGAIAMFVTSEAPDNLIRPTSTGKNRLDDNPIPAFNLGARDLARLKSAARDRTGRARIRWRLAAHHVEGRTRDIVATLPGNGSMPGAVMVAAHYDSWFTGALDNATGVAGLIGLAEHFARVPRRRRPRDLVFIGVTGHDTGYPHGGMNHWARTHRRRVDDLELFVNLDHLAAHGEEHVGASGILDMLGVTVERPGDEERALFTTRHPSLIAAWTPLLLQHGLLPTAPVPSVPEVNANGDLEGLMGELGVPCVNLSMATPHYHTVEDTPDRVPPEQLARAVRAHRDFITQMLGARIR